MSRQEAIWWLTGKNSSWNSHANSNATDTGQCDRSLDMVRCAQEDAAQCERAYWILRSHSEGLISEPSEAAPGGAVKT